ncbi:hypothetical protein QAD02_004179 [Eretmocerus hayati]|uniref:Uncharacterized protein n=1 Tax=Eretmocerus hayati TaxID=131215 RepID=A0ACC2NQ26_9HYME|nr:hypothetical protein QAD02_004179 [Eretmocerus hayati]
MPQSSEIQKFFANKCVLLTGATGFMGKCFVEKILRECPDLKKLYVLVRQKNGQSPEELIKKYFKSVIFDKLRNTNPNFAKNLVVVKGDLLENRLGLSEKDRKILTDEVDIIVHNGANVKFVEEIKVSLRCNVLATKDMLDLAMECKRIIAFMYVSTAYSHNYRLDVEEKFYDPPGDLKMVHDMIVSDEAAKYGLAEDVVQMLLGKWDNIYVFTKAICEDLVRQYGEKADFACGVYRPSIVSAAYDEPLQGWVGNMNGPGYCFLGTALGAVHTSFDNGSAMDLIPSDFCINSLITAIYDLPQRCKREGKPVVYNFGSSTLNPFRVPKAYKVLKVKAAEIGSKHTVWHPFHIFVTQKWMFYILHLLCHCLPAVFVDIVLLVTGNKPRALSLCIMAFKMADKLFIYQTTNWRIHCPEMMKVYDKLNDTDKVKFNYDIRKINWDEFCHRYTTGCRVHVLKEPLDNVPQTRRRYMLQMYLHYTFCAVLLFALVYYISRFF